MRPQTPGVATDNLLQHQSVYKVFRANISMGQPATYDGAGIPITYTQDNTDGIMLRVKWVTPNVDQTIPHNLGRVPIGYYLTRKDQTCDVYDGNLSGWTEANIVLRATTDADTTLYVF